MGPIQAAIEASVTISPEDTRRAVRRAEILERATGTPTRAVIIGESISPEDQTYAENLGAAFCRCGLTGNRPPGGEPSAFWPCLRARLPGQAYRPPHAPFPDQDNRQVSTPGPSPLTIHPRPELKPRRQQPFGLNKGLDSRFSAIQDARDEIADTRIPKARLTSCEKPRPAGAWQQ